MVVAPTVPEGDCAETQSRFNLEGDPSCEHCTPWGSYRQLRSLGNCVHQALLQEWFPTNPGSSEAREGTGTCGLGSFSGTWHWPLLITSPSPPPHLSNNDQCEKIDQGPKEKGFRAQCMIGMDQTEIQASSLSMTSVRAQSTTAVKAQSDCSGLRQETELSAV